MASPHTGHLPAAHEKDLQGRLKGSPAPPHRSPPPRLGTAPRAGSLLLELVLVLDVRKLVKHLTRLHEITRDCSRSPLAHVRASDTAIDSLSVNQSVSSSASTKPAGQSNGPKLPASAFATISARPAPAADTMTHFAAFITSSEIATKSPSARASLPASTTWNEQCRGANNNNDAGEGNSNDDNHKHSENSNQS